MDESQDSSAHPRRRYIAYYRVSTGKQGQFGLSLEAQQSIVREFAAAQQGQLVAEFSETLSGRRDNRPQLAKAVSLCRITRAILVIARLDRLSRSVELIARLMESGLEFVALDAPHANKFTIHILAALAEYESNLMSERMKDIRAATKARGVKLGNFEPHGRRGFPPGAWEASAKTRRARMLGRARDLAPLIWQWVREGKSYAVIASDFNSAGIVPPRRAPWSNQSVCRIARLTRHEFVRAETERLDERFGCAQARVSKQLADVGPLLVDLWRAGKTYEDMADALAERGVLSPWGRHWGPASIRRYLLLALGAPSLREERRTDA